MKKRIMSVFMTILLISVLGVSGCGTSAENSAQNDVEETAENIAEDTAADTIENKTEKVTEISYLAMCDRDSIPGRVFYPLFDKWQEENPDIKVNLEYVGGEDLKIKVMADASANMLADVFYFWGTLSNNAYLLQNDLVCTTEEVVEKVDTLKMENLDETTRKIISYKGTPYGVPMNGTHAGFYINKRIYEECGVPFPDTYDVYTYDQFRKDGEVFREHGYIPLAIGWQAGNPGHFYLSELINQLPGGMDGMTGLLDYQDMTGNGNLTKAMEYVVEDIDLGMYQDSVLNDSWNEMLALYQEQRAAATYSHCNVLANNLNDEMMENTLVMPFPRIEECENACSDNYYPFAVAYSHFVSKDAWHDSEKQDAIVRFLEFLYGEELQKGMASFDEPVFKFDFEITSDEMSLIAQRSLEFSKGKEQAPFFLAAVPDATAWQDFKNTLMDCASQTITPEECEEKVGEIFREMKPEE